MLWCHLIWIKYRLSRMNYPCRIFNLMARMKKVASLACMLIYRIYCTWDSWWINFCVCMFQWDSLFYFAICIEVWTGLSIVSLKRTAIHKNPFQVVFISVRESFVSIFWLFTSEQETQDTRLPWLLPRRNMWK